VGGKRDGAGLMRKCLLGEGRAGRTQSGMNWTSHKKKRPSQHYVRVLHSTPSRGKSFTPDEKKKNLGPRKKKKKIGFHNGPIPASKRGRSTDAGPYHKKKEHARKKKKKISRADQKKKPDALRLLRNPVEKRKNPKSSV